MPDKPVKVQGTQIDPGLIDAAFRAVRAHADKSMYGRYISDAECRSVATEVVTAITEYNSGEVI